MKNKILHYLKVEVKPWKYPDSYDNVLEVTIRYDDKEFHIQKILPSNDLQSLFDRIWRYLGDQIKEKLLEESND